MGKNKIKRTGFWRDGPLWKQRLGVKSEGAYLNSIVLTFGQYRGQPLTAVDDAYLSWLGTLRHLAPWLEDAIMIEALRRARQKG